jgi:hypothetical protein
MARSGRSPALAARRSVIVKTFKPKPIKAPVSKAKLFAQRLHLRVTIPRAPDASDASDALASGLSVL